MKNTFVKVLSMMMALMMVVGILTVVPATAAECNHTKGEYIDGKDPTCQTPGFSRYICGECDEEWITDIIQASDEYHKVENVPAVAASCLTAGYAAGRRCLVPGCTEIAEGCGKVADAKAHTFVGKEVAPTCFDQGWVVYTCTSCNYTAEQLSGDATTGGVDFDGNGVVDAGDNKFLVATQTYADNAKVATGKAQLVHKYVWTVVTAPVNTNGVCTDGLAKGVCANCKDEQTTVIPVDHNYVLINATNLPCIEWNNQAKWCSNCHKIQPGDENKKHETTGHNTNKTYDGVLNPENAAFDALVDAGEFKLSELYALGLKLNDKLFVDSTCTTAGYQLAKCSCGHLYLKPIAAKGHAWGEWSAYSEPTLCTEPSVKTRSCGRSCGVADEVSVYAPAAHSAHAYKNDVTAPDCTEMGFTTTTCTNKITINGRTYQCGYSDVNTWVDNLGHAWGEAVLVSGSCDNGDWDKNCTRKDCTAKYEATEGETVTPTDAQKKHAWGAAVDVAGTCQEASYSYKKCTKCNYYFVNNTTVSATLTESAKLRDENDKIDAANHVYVRVRWADATPNCTTASAVEVVKCQYCDVDGNTEITRVVNNPVAHTPVTGYVTVSGNTKTPHAGGRDATCQYVGYNADGKYCSECLTVITPPSEIAKNPAKHVDTPSDANKVGAYVGATCQSAGYQKHYLSCCKEIIVYSTTDTKKADCTSGYVTVPYDAAECLTNGNHTYIKCQWCGTIKPDSVDTTGCTQCSAATHEAAEFANNPVIPAIGHAFPNNNNVAEVIESGSSTPTRCDDTIVLAHKSCTNGCGYVQFNGVTYKNNTEAAFLAAARQLPHYNAFKQTFTDRDSTCTSAGIYGGEYCTVCQKDQWIDPVDAHNFAHSITSKIFTVNYNAGARVDCTKDACIVTECATCTAKDTEYIYAADANHNWTNWADVTIAGPTCKNDQMQERHCQDCATGLTEETRVKENGAKTGCYTTKGVTNGQKFFISYDCDKIANFIGWTCDVCHTAITNANVEDLAQHHKDDPVTKAPTCTEDGYEIEYCTGCGLTEKTGAVDFQDPIYVVKKPTDGDYTHDKANGILLEDTAAYTKYICADCKETVTENKAAPAPELVVTATPSSKKVAAGETFTVTYALSGKAYEFAALNLQATIPANMTLTGIKSEVEGLVAVVAPNGGISLVVPNDAEGNAQKVKTTAEGTALFTLTYSVNMTAASANATVSVSDKATTNALATATTAAIAVTAVGNLNGDALVSAEDAQAIFAKVGTNDVAADVNLDGVVTLADVIALAKFAASAKTAADYLEMVGELDKLEDEVFALYEAGRLNDVNGDKVVNIADAYKLIEKVETALAAGYATLGNNVTMAAVVAAQNRA